MIALRNLNVPEGFAIRPTRAIIDLDALAGNVRIFRKSVTASTKIMAVVKANGYGHGARMIARTALKAGADQLAVATVQEAIVLRQDGIVAPLLVLGPIDLSEIETAIDHKLRLAVGDVGRIEELDRAVGRRSGAQPLELHLKIDTGMHRYGCNPDEAVTIATAIAERKTLHLAGVFTHFACADEADESPTIDQVHRYERAVQQIREQGIDPGLRHAANSAATLRSRRYDFDMVRVGMAMYGIAPSRDVPLAPGMQAAMSVLSKIGRISQLQPGDRVSYGGTYQARQSERVALVPIGYGDGYRRSLSNRTWMEVAGARSVVRGRVCMDQTVVNLPDGVEAEVGETVVVVGQAPAPSWDDLADLVGTIPYELTTGIAARVPRLYFANGQLQAVEDFHGLTEFT